MVAIIEITAVVLAVLTLFAATVTALRNAVSFRKTAVSLQERVQPALLELAGKSDVAQEHALRVTGKADILQRNVFRLMITMNRMWILLSALAEVNRKVSRVRSYVGL